MKRCREHREGEGRKEGRDVGNIEREKEGRKEGRDVANIEGEKEGRKGRNDLIDNLIKPDRNTKTLALAVVRLLETPEEHR